MGNGNPLIGHPMKVGMHAFRSGCERLGQLIG